MDPIHLQDEEIDYELWVRQITDLDQAHVRVKTGRLREILAKESIGIMTTPAQGTSPFPPNFDLDQCAQICDYIRNQLLDEELTKLDLEQILSRMMHVNKRLPRILPQNSSQSAAIRTITTAGYDLWQMTQERIRTVNPNVRKRNVTEIAPDKPSQIPPYNRTLNRASMYDEVRQSVAAQLNANANQQAKPIPTATAPPPTTRASALPRTPIPLTRARSLEDIAAASSSTHTSAPIQSNQIVTVASTAPAAVTTRATATITTVAPNALEPSIFNQRRSTGFWDRTNQTNQQTLNHLAPEFFPENRPSLLSEILSIQNNAPETLIDFGTNPFAPNTNMTPLVPNTVRFNTAALQGPLAHTIEHTIPDPYMNMLNTNGDLCHPHQCQSRPMAPGYSNNRCTFPYTHTQQSVPIYVDTPFRADAGIHEMPSANAAGYAFANRINTQALATAQQTLSINPTSHNNTNEPNNYQLARPPMHGSEHVTPLLSNNRALPEPPNANRIDLPTFHNCQQPDRNANPQVQAYDYRNHLPPPIYNRQENNLYRTYIMNQMQGEQGPGNGAASTNRPRQNAPMMYGGQNVPNYNHCAYPPAPCQNYHCAPQHACPANHRNPRKLIPINAWKLHFSGETNLGKDEHGVNDFITLVTQYKNNNLIDDDYMLQNVGFLLRKSALNWYLGILPSLRTWDDFLHRLKTKYLSNNTSFEILSEIENRLQGKTETVTTYIADMVDRFRSMPYPLSEEHQCHIIQKNLLKANAMKLAERRYKTVIQLEQACRNLESMRKHFRLNPFSEDRSDRSHKPRGVNAVEPATWDSDVEYTVNESESEEENNLVCEIKGQTKTNRKPPTRTSVRNPPKPKSDYQNSSKPKPPSDPNKPRDEKCYNCLKFGHWFIDCPSPISRVFCFRCGKENMYATECTKCHPERAKLPTQPPMKAKQNPTREKPNREKPKVEEVDHSGEEEEDDVNVIEIRTVFETLPNDSRPYVRVKMFRHELLGLLDSGASVSLLGRKANVIIPPQFLSPPTTITHIKTADGTNHAIEAVAKIPISLEHKRKIVELLVVPGISRPLILGTNFWKAFGIFPSMTTEAEAEAAMISEEILKPSSPKPLHFHDLSPEQKNQLENTKSQFKFSKPNELGFTPLIEHHIDTGDAKPIKQRPHRVSPYVQEKINEEIDRMVSLGIIEKAHAPTWLSPVHPVKKSDGRVRLCLDARRVNEFTLKNAYPQQNANRILQRISGTKFLSSLDLSDAYYQIKVHPDSRNHTAFSVSSKGTYRYIRMPNGLCNASGTLCELIDNIIGCDLEPHVFPYMDDFIICTPTFELHLEMLSQVAKRLREAGLSISSTKSHFCLKQVKYLGFIISDEGIFPDPDKIRPIVEYPKPNNVKAVRRLVGMAGYYRAHIKNFSSLSSPITELLKKKYLKFQWTETANAAFLKLKEALATPPILTPPDYSKPFSIHCDASEVGLGAVLMQTIDEHEKVIAYYSTKLSPAESRYSPTERECLAVIRALEHFRTYTEGVCVNVVTDHSSLLWLKNIKEPNSKLTRWSLRLQAHDFTLTHRKGKFNVVPDALSRAPVTTIEVEKLPQSTDPDYLQLLEKAKQNELDSEKYRIENDILLINTEKTREPHWRIVIPTDFIEPTLVECHSDILAGHGGFWKTYMRVKQQYCWTTMRHDIAKFIRNCEVCKAVKPTNQNEKGTMGSFRDPKAPWRSISIDFVGPLPRSKQGHKWILTVVDNFSKYVHIIPLRDATATLATKALERDIFLRFGVPQTVILDNGTQFKSKLFNEFIEKHKVTLHFTPNYHPQANPCEAANKVIGTTIRCYLDKHQHREWDTIVYQIQCAINNTAHHSTNSTPFEIIFGRKMITAGDRHDLTTGNDIETDELLPKLQIIRQEVRTALREAHEKSTKQYNLRARPNKHEIGDQVWKKNTVLSNKTDGIMHKLLKRYDKCTVIAHAGHNIYTLADEKGRTIGNFHSKMLKT